jgi:sugar lactone lactonase YvrE
MASKNILAIVGLLLTGVLTSAAEETALFASRRVVPPPSEYTNRIEGPSVDATGILYIMNFREDGRIGKLRPGASRSEPFAKLPNGSIGSGSRFDRDGRMYVADFKGNTVFVFERGQSEPQVYFHSGEFNQPNDLAIAADGTLYASDPDRKHGTGTGRVWRITRGPDGKGTGEVMSSDRPTPMGLTNGIEVSPDGATLYVGESKFKSKTPELWAYRLDGPKLVAPRPVKPVKKFDDADLDGMRTDIDGRIFAARPDKGMVVVLSPDGTVVREVRTRANGPTNLAFGGPDGKTVFVTQSDGGFIEAFRTDRPGREHCLQPSAPGC